MQGFKEARLLRLQQVRQQEKLLSLDRCDAYRKVIENRTQLKTDFIKSALISDKKKLHDKLTRAWQGSLVDTGYGHRTALEITSGNNVRKRTVKAADIERKLIAGRRGRAAVVERSHKLAAQKSHAVELVERASLRIAAMASDREDARAAAEAKSAEHSRNTTWKAHKAHVSAHSNRSSNVANMTQQSAVRIQDRGFVAKDTNIIRYGKVGIHETSSTNCARAEARNALVKQWGMVMKEMRHRNAITTRALIAHKTLRSTNQMEVFRSELSLLTLADKSLCRSAKSRNVASVIAASDKKEVVPTAARAFEREFLSTFNICNSESDNTGYTMVEKNSAYSSIAATLRGAASGTKMPLSVRQPIMWEEEPMTAKLRSNTTESVSTSSSFHLYNAVQRNIRSALEESSVRQSRLISSPPIWSAPPVTESKTDVMMPSVGRGDDKGGVRQSSTAALGVSGVIKNDFPLRNTNSTLKVTELFLPAFPFSEEVNELLHVSKISDTHKSSRFDRASN